ncbi:MAG: hypothetical protein NC115_09915 [Bacteroidales bacterium]|nr:hypothetical protein [Bacteroidales bacterium]
MRLKDYILFILFFVVLITSLWPNNIYLLVFFSIISLLFLPFKKWWDGIAVCLVLFSLFYCLMECRSSEIGSGFIFLSHLFSPVAFYRFGRWTMSKIVDEKLRFLFLFFVILSYLLPLFLLTVQDIALVGIVNETRQMLSDIGKEDDMLSATLYGLMTSAGIGGIAMLLLRDVPIKYRISFVSLSILSMMVVLHLVNRTGVALFAICLVFTLFASSKKQISSIVISMFLILLLVFLLFESGIISSELIDAYIAREDTSTSSSSEFGGRSAIWNDAFHKLFTSPLGWKKVRYAHNLWLDIARVGGWLSLFPFLVATIHIISNMIHLFRKKTSPVYSLVIIILISMFCNSAVEPVVDASPLFFSLLIMFWGIVKTVFIESKRTK